MILDKFKELTVRKMDPAIHNTDQIRVVYLIYTWLIIGLNEWESHFSYDGRVDTGQASSVYKVLTVAWLKPIYLYNSI